MRHSHSKSVFLSGGNWVFVVTLVIYFILVGAFGCSNSKTAERVLKSDGYTDIQITGWAGPFAGGKGDWYNTGFTAKKNNQIINGVVSEGLIFKGSTIRIK